MNNNTNNEQFEKCLKCKYLDDSDMPNLFCKLTNDLVNDGDFTICPLAKTKNYKVKDEHNHN